MTLAGTKLTIRALQREVGATVNRPITIRFRALKTNDKPSLTSVVVVAVRVLWVDDRRWTITRAKKEIPA